MKQTKKRVLSGFMAAVLAVGMTGSFGVSSVMGDDGENSLIAFPGAEGGGMYTQGARAGEGYSIYRVTNLGDSGSGSFPDAVSQSNRIIVFDVAGNINLSERLKISASNLTILGQTAPGEGICIGGEGVYVTGSQIIMRYLRFRMGDNSTSQEDALGGKNTSDIILDHCSISWSEDEDLSFYAVKDFTAQYCIISESLNNSNHSKGAHGYGGIWGGQNASFHHNLIASHNSRTPRIGTSATVSSYKGKDDRESLVDIRNNVIYNWGSNSAYGGENGVRVNLVNNYYKPGPATEKIRFYQHYAASSNGGLRNDGSTLYAGGNVMEGYDELTNDNWAGVDTYSDSITWTKCESISDGVEYNGELLTNDQYIYDYPITTLSAEDAYNDVLANAGANIIRDETDERVVNDVINGTAPTGSITGYGLIDSQDDVGGWCNLYGTKKTDTDKDGIPDEWEDSHGLDKTNKSDSISLASSGYTYIEEYANEIAANALTDVDRSSFRKILAEIDELDSDNYEESSYNEFLAVFDAQLEIYSDPSATQSEINTATAKLEAALNTLLNEGMSYSAALPKLIEQAEALDPYTYTAASYSVLQSAITSAEAKLSASSSESVLKSAYNTLNSAILALETSARVELKELLDEKKLLCPAELENLDAYYKAISDGEAVCDDFSTSEKVLADCVENIKEAKANLSGDFEDSVIRQVDFNNISKDSTFKKAVDNTTTYTSAGTDLDNVHFHAINSNLTFLKNLYDNDTYFCTFISNIVNEKNGYIYFEPYYVYTYPDGSQDQHEFTFEDGDGDSYINYIDVMFNCDIEEYDYIEIDSGNDNSFLIEDNDTLSISIKNGENMKFNYHFEPETWYRFAFEVNPKENTMSFYVGGDIILENYVLPLTVYAMGPGLYAVSSNENAVVAIDNYTYISRNYDSGSEYVVYPFTGDADSSGALTANDAAVILAKVLNGDFTMAVERNNSDGIDYIYKVDADGDGVLTANDAAMILRRVLDSAYVLPGEEVTIVVESTTEATTETTTESTTETTTQTTTESSTETTTETPTESTTYFIPMDEPTTEFYLDWGDETEPGNILMTRVLEQAVIKETFL